MGMLLRNVGLLPLIILSLSACTEAVPDGDFLGSSLGNKAELTNLPNNLNNAVSFTPGVSPNNNIEYYQYKAGLAASTDCSDPTGYSAETLQTAPISVSTSTDGLHRLCVVGRDYEGQLQAYDDATEWTWTRDREAPNVVSFNRVTAAQTSGTTIEYDLVFDKAMNFSTFTSSAFNISPNQTIDTEFNGASEIDPQTARISVDVLSAPITLMSVTASLNASMVRDLAGNVSAGAVSAAVTHDSEGPMISISNPTSGYVTSAAQMLVATCEGNLPLTVSGDVSGSPILSACSDGSLNLAVTLTGGQGTNTITINQNDALLNPGSASVSVDLDSQSPSVLSIDSGTIDGTYTNTEVVNIRVNFSEPVFLSAGTLNLDLETGANDAVASFDAASNGSSTLEFNFTVVAAELHSSYDLDVASASALMAVGGALSDIAGNAANLNLPLGGSGNGLSDNADLKIVGMPAMLSFSNGPSYNFSGVMEGDVASVQLSLTNSGGFTADLTGLSGFAAPFSEDTGQSDCGLTLAPGASCFVGVQFSPIDTAFHSMTLDMVYNDGIAPGQLASRDIQGAGTVNADPQITAALCFADAYEGQTYSCTPEVLGINESGDGATAWRLENNTCGFLSINSATGFISGIPSSTHRGRCSFQVIVDDGYNGDSNSWKVAMDVHGGTGIGSMGLGSSHSCVVKDGEIYCWGGGNASGSLGRGSSVPSQDDVARPVVDSSLTAEFGANRVENGLDYSCARFGSGDVRCWGDNSSSELGYADGDSYYTVSMSLSNVTDLALGRDHGCALEAPNGDVKCWGMNGPSANLGRGFVSGNYPVGDVLIPGPSVLTDIIDISSRGNHTCALSKDRSLYCWGSNSFGELGRESFITHGTFAEPVVNFGSGLGQFHATSVSAGFGFTCANLDDGNTVCWGNGSAGRLGYENPASLGRLTGDISGLGFLDFGTGLFSRKVQSGFGHSCTLLSDNTIKCWGSNGFGELGLGTSFNQGDGPGEMGDSLAVVSLPPGTLKDFRVGMQHSCAIIENGSEEVYCWGRSDNYKLGTTGGSVGDGPGEMGSNLNSVFFDSGSASNSIIFVSSAVYDGSYFGGLSGADIECQNLATTGGLPNPSTFMAVLGDSVTDANTRLAGFTSPIYNTNVINVAIDAVDLFDGALDNSIEFNENGVSAGTYDVWSHSLSNGTSMGNVSNSCNDWTSNSAGNSGALGDAMAADASWIDRVMTQTCDNVARLYCIGNP